MDPEVIAKELKDGLTSLKQILSDVKSKTDEHETKAAEHQQKIDDLNAGIENMKTALLALQTVQSRPDVGSASGVKTLGQLLVESTQYKEMVDQQVPNCKSVKIEGGFGALFRRKDLTSSTGPDVQAQRVPQISVVRFEQPRIRDLINVFQTSSSAVDYVKETRWNQLSSLITVEAAAAQADIDVANINGFKPGSTITIDPDGVGTTETAVVLSVTAATAASAAGTITCTANLSNTHAVGIEVVSDEFQFTPETTLKPTANAKFSLEQAGVKTLAHWIPASRQILDDAPGLRAHVDQRLLEGLALSEEKEILYGDNTSNRLRGIISDASTQTYSWSSGLVGDTKLDALRRAITLATLAHYPVDGIILHPTDWEQIETAKGDDGHYLFKNAPTATAVPTVWGVPVVVSTQINSGTALLGAFRMGVALWDRMQSTIRIAEQHASFFIENMVAILAEERIALTLYRPESFVAVTFDSAPTP